ncbi:MAG: prepilin-type N-terminal cleavage/methylation domain-containing protein [Candidatus Xenobiia bacterium LiM19]
MKRFKRGVTLLELLVAMIVLLIGLFVVFNLFPRAFAIAYKARAREIAYHMAQTKIERIFAHAVSFNTSTYSSSGDLAGEFYTTFNGTGTGNPTASDSSVDTIFTIPSTTMSNVSYTDYRKFESTYYGNIYGYNQYYYRPEVANISDPHLLYLDQVTRRLTIYVTIPPVIPGNSNSNLWASEKTQMDKGNVVVVAAIRTNRKISALTGVNAPNGTDRIYVASKEDSFKFPIFNKGDDSRTTTSMMMGGATVSDLDFPDSYSKIYASGGSTVTYGGGSITGRSVYDVSGHYSYPVELRPSCSDSPDYLLNFINTKTLTYSPAAGVSVYVDPANFCAVISDGTNMEPIQIIDRGYDSTYGYYLTLQNPLQKAPTATGYYAAGSSIYAWIYLLNYR